MRRGQAEKTPLQGGASDQVWEPGDWFRIIPLRFELEPEADLELPAYEGAMLRGALGHALRRMACVTGMQTCEGCAVVSHCPYVRLFESTPAVFRGMSRPHPWMLAVDAQGRRRCEAGERFRFGLVVLGPARQNLIHLIAAVKRMGWQGLGRDRVPCRLISVFCQDAAGDWRSALGAASKAVRPGLPPVPSRVRVELITPLRMKRSGRLLSQHDFRPADLFHSLRQRMTLLQEVFAPRDPGPTAAAAIPDEALDVVASESNLEWFEWTRYSTRQRRRMRMGGIRGSFVLGGERLAPVWPLLWYGQWIHAGKLPTMGLGRYQIWTAASLP